MIAALAQLAPELPTHTGEAVTFYVVFVVAVGSAGAMVCLRNTVHAALMLVLNFFAIAVLYALLEAQFLAVIQLIVYAGAIVVLFLFVLMLLGVARDEVVGSGPVRGATTGGVIAGLALAGLLTVAVAAPWFGAGSLCGAPGEGGGLPCAGLAAANVDGNVQGIGRILFTDYVWPFEVSSVLLVIAALGAMVLGRRDEDPDDLIDLDPSLDGHDHDGLDDDDLDDADVDDADLDDDDLATASADPDGREAGT